MFSHVAGLGDVPWVMAGDWNAAPGQLWVPALAPRTSGWLPDVGGRMPTCFPVKKEPTENISLIKQFLRGAVTDYEFMPVGVLPTHRAVRLTLKLAAPREPVRTLKKPRTIQRPEPGGGHPQAGHQAPWTRPGLEAPGARLAWDAWTKAAEDWLLGRAGISQGKSGPTGGGALRPSSGCACPPHRDPSATRRGAWQGQGVGSPGEPLPGAGLG